MATKREQILAKIKTNLTGTTGVGTRIYRSRAEPMTREESPSLVVEFVTDEPTVNSATYLKLDCEKSINLLKWKPFLNIEQTLDLIAKWYELEKDGEKSLQETYRQIDYFENSISAEN